MGHIRKSYVEKHMPSLILILKMWTTKRSGWMTGIAYLKRIRRITDEKLRRMTERIITVFDPVYYWDESGCCKKSSALITIRGS